MARKFVIEGGSPLKGSIRISGSKNVVTKAVIAACLTDEPVILRNVPEISDFEALLGIIETIGGTVERTDGTVKIQVKEIKNHELTLEVGARVRTSSMFLSPLLLRVKRAIVPNPEGCRLGARSIERHIEALESMGAEIQYRSEDGYYHASTAGLYGTTYRFEKNTHTGTETLIMAATLASGTTTIENAAEEHEIDDLISLLNSMGAKINRVEKRKIVIEGVEKLHGTEYEIVSDANELVTFAVLSVLSGGNISLTNVNLNNVGIFLEELSKCGITHEASDEGVRFFAPDGIKPSAITTAPEPGFKTDWQGPWAVLMTQAVGASTIHETIYENRFGYVPELKKMGAKIEYFDPKIENPQDVYNFNYNPKSSYKQAIRITGPQKLHNAVLTVSDLRAGATLVMGALIADGQSILYGIEHLERGYEKILKRLQSAGAQIEEVEE
jgi:UDP-N-acetylglucosamine 1-carboxyvinyltransferase